MRTPGRQDRKIAGLILLIAGGVPAIASVLALGGRWSWVLDLLANFRVQYAIVLAPVVVLNVFLKRYRVAGLLTLPLALNVGLILPLYLPPERAATTPVAGSHAEADTESDAEAGVDADAGADAEAIEANAESPTLRIVQFNINIHNARKERVVDYLSDLDADILLLQEVTSRWLEQYQFRLGIWMIRHAQPREDNFGLAVLERYSNGNNRPRVGEVRVVDLTDDRLGIPALEMDVTWQERSIALLSIHAVPPHNRRSAAIRNGQLRAAGLWAQRQAGPTIIVGDLNATPWSHVFANLLETSGMLNSQRGFGIQGTWPAGGGPLGKIPIDHLLHSDELMTIDRQLGPGLGSDHHPLIVELRWALPVEAEADAEAESGPDADVSE